MKFSGALAVLAVLLVGAESAQDKTITKVIKLLQDMLDKSKSVMEKERVLYAKFKCFCDLEAAEKEAEITELKEQIPVVESKIAQLIAATNELTIEAAQLKFDINNGNAEVEAAEKARSKGKDSFVSEEKDLSKAVAQMDKAIEVLEALVGPKPGGAFMAGRSEVVKKAVLVQEVDASDARQALAAVSVFLTPQQQQLVHEKTEAFLQGVSSGAVKEGKHGEWEVIKFLKMMLVEFEKNMHEIQKTEGAACATYEAYMETKTKMLKDLKGSLDAKTEGIANNEDELASKRGQLADMQEQLANAEEALANLLKSCADKAIAYEKRKRERANEEAAISQALSILNSDSAFESFGKVKATVKGRSNAAGFLQVSSRRHLHRHEGATFADAAALGRAKASAVLKATVVRTRSLRLARVAALLEEGGPFDVVLYKIGELLDLIDKEGAMDAQNFDFCNEEREENHKNIAEKEDDITTLKDEIEGLTNDIHDPKTGLLVQIEKAEATLKKNQETQKEETEERAEEHADYLEDMANCADAEEVLERAIAVLNVYYKGGSLLQTGRAWKREPETWEEGSSTKQSDSGNEVIDMLEFIIKETKKEADEHQKAEDKSKKDYDESMVTLKDEEASLEKSIAKKTETVAEKRVEIMEKTKELKAAKDAKAKMETYLEKIKPGCDFIEDNIDERNANRKTEKSALEEARGIIKEIANK